MLFDFASKLLMALGLWLLAGCTAVDLQSRCPGCQHSLISIESPLGPLISMSRRKQTTAARLHVYFEGDGRPWQLRTNQPADDPNSHNLVALKLMQLDPGSAVYLSRPCYAIQPMPSSCTAIHWTDGRYGEQVIAAIDEALSHLALAHAASELVLIGHSGGGTIAMLVAARRRDVVAVITLAANLNHQAWTDWFGYLPLSTSLNAMDVELPTDALRWHFAAEHDRSVPTTLIANAAHQDPYARFEVISGIDHSCCWQESWPKILVELERTLGWRTASPY